MRQINLEGLLNDRKFQLVAFLVDREDFLSDLEAVRKSLGLDRLINYSDVRQYLIDLGTAAQKNGQEIDSLTSTNEDGTDSSILTSSKLYNSVIFLEDKYKKDSQFDMVIAYSILSGEVRDSELMGTAHVQFLDKESVKTLELDGEFQISIVVTRDTKLPEVERLFQGEVQRMFDQWDWSQVDTFPNIKRNRDWYWKKKQMSWDRLQNYAKSHGDIVEIGSIRDAVGVYTAKLQIDLYSKFSPTGLEDS